MAKGYKKRDKVKLDKSVAPKKVTTDSLPKKNNVSFDFSYTDWLKTIKIGEFTNKLKNPGEFADLIFVLMNQMIPYITANWNWIEKTVYLGSDHNCHPVTKEKLPLVKKIIKDTHSIDLGPIVETERENVLWQLGHKGKVRLIVYYMESDTTFYPLFVDYHHLIHPVKGDRRSQIKHNDYKSKSWCPVEFFK